MAGYTMGYSDHNRDVADEIFEAHHLRYIRLPSGRKLYTAVDHTADDGVIEELRALCVAGNRTETAK